MSNIIISTTDEYIVVKIPKNSLIGRKPAKTKTLTETEVLKIFNAAKKDFETGKLKEVDSLAQLL
jgi:hypothetical protein